MATAAGAKAKKASDMAHGTVLTALKFISDDKLDWVPMGKAKTPRAIALECAGAYAWTAAIIRSEVGPEAWLALEGKDYPTRAALVQVLNEQYAILVAALEAATEEQLGGKRQAFWGEATVAELLDIGGWHSTWHAGQLNYIQTLLGDEESHWE